MNDRVAESLQVLELRPGASPDEIKRAYRELVKVWHPDRFPSDEALKHRAQEKLKQINNAYEILTSLNGQDHPKAAMQSDRAASLSRFVFYRASFDEMLVGNPPCKSPRANALLTSAFFAVIRDETASDRRVKCHLQESLPTRLGAQCVSHSDSTERYIILNGSIEITIQSLLLPLVRVYLRDRLNGVASGCLTKETALRALRCANWDGRTLFESESYLNAESQLCTLGTQDLLDRLFDEGSASWAADTKAMFRAKWKGGPNTLEDSARLIGFGVKEDPAY